MDNEKSELLLYKTADKRTEIEVRLEGDTVWLSQKQMGDLFQKDVRTINEHIVNIFKESELPEASVIRNYRITASDNKTYDVQHYNLDVIISVGYRVKSLRGTQFRQWATQRLREYLVKGFTLDDERLKEGGTKNKYFDELLERVRDIRTSEKNFYRKITDIYSTSIDYDENARITQEFFATVQNKFHYAITGHTAAELITERASASKPNMGLTTWKAAPRGPIRKSDVAVAKNYYREEELQSLNLIVDQYLSFAEFQAMQKKPMHMKDWIKKLHDFLTLNERNILQDAGKVSHSLAVDLANKQFDLFDKKQKAFAAENPVSDFDRAIKRIESKVKKPKKKPK